ncbi:tol-pal system-associated acyl-CoA thioesterase [Affinibrenneria salicis]|uniref:tol-pal system-associated acyl-CoA thioesterase n=1 Tax=Affinibrenneria salicis TaxID=2590031 RepID=UPI001CC7E49E|nr:tol-pal system-associated acyl-CoA thioesterase [Affinibrenneria salicis]
MRAAVNKRIQQVSPAWFKHVGGLRPLFISPLAALVLVTGLSTAAVAAPASVPPASAGAGEPAVQTAPAAPVGQQPAAPGEPAPTPLAAGPEQAGAPLSPLTLPQSAGPQAKDLMRVDLSVWGMYQHADVVVKTVMIGLLLASVVTWALFFSKSVNLLSARRRLRREYQELEQVKNLDEAADTAATFKGNSVSARLLQDARDELELSSRSDDNNGIKERTAFRLERRVAATGRKMSNGNGYLATIGAVAPFVGLFGTVWGIMNSFIGIAQTQTTNLAVVAPGIAEALLATAIGLVAAIPAVVIYNLFARQIAGYKAIVSDVAAQILLLQSRDLDVAASEENRSTSGAQKLRVG